MSKLNKETQERIKADADTYVRGLSITNSKAHQHAGYIAGATDVYERAELMEEVLKYITHCPATYDKKELLMWIDSAIEKAKVALEQWKSGKPDRPCPHCGKELSRDRNLCCRECGEEVGPTNDKCCCVQPNWNAFTGKCLTCGKP